MSSRKGLEDKFKIYSGEWLESDLRIEHMELNEEEVPEELYEKRFVMWENLNFILDQAVKLGYVE
jgi:hypothetical protein